jgi:hypothetical protein
MQSLDTDALLPGIPSESLADWRRLLAEPVTGLDALRLELDFYLAHVRAEAAGARALTVSLAVAEGIASACEALLDHLGAAPSARSHRLAQAAIRYFILEEDGEGDLASHHGFDDDAEVVNAVCDDLGLPIRVALAHPEG